MTSSDSSCSIFPALPAEPVDVLVEFKEQVNDLNYLEQAQCLAHWDMQTLMPKLGAEERGKQLVTLSKLSHQILSSDAMQENLEALNKSEKNETLDELDQQVLKEMTYRVGRATKLSSDLVQRFKEAGARGFNLWVKAREENNFKAFQPVLEELVELNQERAKAFGFEADPKNPYNALLENYERGLTVTQIDPLFAQLKTDLVELLQAIKSSGVKPDESLFQANYPEAEQLKFAEELVQGMGFDFDRGCIKKSVHPFTIGIGGSRDIRITVRFKDNDPTEGISTALHEGGHALYEQGVSTKYLGLPLGDVPSLGNHESQSRLWENNVGKSRAYWQHYFPIMQKYFPSQVGSMDLDTFYQSINLVRPGFIRVEADEVTYNLHIMIRYELEKDLIHGRLLVKDLPDAWNTKYEEYLGITPPTDTLGCLQDVHWSDGSMGYFPTYTLGNLYAAQYFNTAQSQINNLDESIASGNLTVLKEWLNENIHQYGCTLSASEICEKVTGEQLNPKHFTGYLWKKYGELYKISRG